MTRIEHSCFCNCLEAAGICLLRLRRVVELLENVPVVADEWIESADVAETAVRVVAAVAADAAEAADSTLSTEATVETVLIDD